MDHDYSYLSLITTLCRALARFAREDAARPFGGLPRSRLASLTVHAFGAAPAGHGSRRSAARLAASPSAHGGLRPPFARFEGP